jgi:hypothetical protein
MDWNDTRHYTRRLVLLVYDKLLVTIVQVGYCCTCKRFWIWKRVSLLQSNHEDDTTDGACCIAILYTVDGLDYTGKIHAIIQGGWFYQSMLSYWSLIVDGVGYLLHMHRTVSADVIQKSLM